MGEKKKFLLRIDSDIYAALEKWAADDLRSINSQIEFILTDALRKCSRLKNQGSENRDITEENQESSGEK